MNQLEIKTSNYYALISNAIKYSPESDHIIVQANKNGEYITVTVQDFGIGVSLDEREKIFDRFYRVSDKKRESFLGLGIGLYISHEIISRHGGTIGIENTAEKDSRFYFKLPEFDSLN